MKEVRKFLFSFFLGSGLIGYALRAAGGGRRGGRENWRPNRKLAVEQWEAPPPTAGGEEKEPISPSNPAAIRIWLQGKEKMEEEKKYNLRVLLLHTNGSRFGDPEPGP